MKRRTRQDENPARIYLVSIAHGSHWGMAGALEKIADF